MKKYLLLILTVVLSSCGDGANTATPAGDTASDGELDICFCMNTISTDSAVLEACDAILPENPTDVQLARILARCAQ